MELKVTRTTFTAESTIGEFYINGIYHFFSLEDKDRQRQSDGTIISWTPDIKIPKVTAIPRGRYEVIINFSNRFQKQMPLLLNVPSYDGIRIHSGNTDENTEGCILVGLTRKADFIGNSQKAFSKLMNILNKANKQEKIWITIQ